MPRTHGSGKPGNLRFSAREQLKEIIQHMDLEQDNRLPLELELANQLGIGRTTLRKILEELELEPPSVEQPPEQPAKPRVIS